MVHTTQIFLVTTVAMALLAALAAEASQLVVPAVGAPDSILQGATVGEPRTPSAAAFSNPAGLTLFGDRELSLSASGFRAHTAVQTSAPPGYNNDRNSYGFGPEFGVAFEGPGGWHFGIASYGSVGSSFKSNADPAVGVNSDFYSELSIANVALVAARNLTDKLSVGASISMLFGWMRFHYPRPDIPPDTLYNYSLRGPGVQAIVGARYAVTDEIALGLGIRLPGMLWADGNMRKFDGDGQDVDIDIKMPAQVFAGINMDATRRLALGLYARWSDTSSFGHSHFRFADTPQGDIPLMPGATDEWRIGGGFEYALTERLKVGLGAAHADAVVGVEGISPLLIDAPETKIDGGLSYAFDDFTVDFLAGHCFVGDRHIKPGEAAIFPGRYSISGQILQIGLRTTF